MPCTDAEKAREDQHGAKKPGRPAIQFFLVMGKPAAGRRGWLGWLPGRNRSSNEAAFIGRGWSN